MKIVLSDIKSLENDFSSNVIVKHVNLNRIEEYNNNKDVVAIAGSRAMAIKCADMSLPGLRLFQLTSAGFDGVPCQKYAERNIAVANAGSVYSAPIAETVVFGMLTIAKKLRKNPNNRHFKIQRHYTEITELLGKNVLIMGAGNIGTAVAERLKGFGMNIDGYDPYCDDKPQFCEIIRSKDELLNSLSKYDYIVSTMPDNEQTKNMIDISFFSKMKKSAVVINVGRRAVFNEDDFYNALKKQIICGAVLDMFEKIPNPLQNKFRRLKNVVVLPGVAAISREVNERLRIHMTNNILSAINGDEIKNVINGVK